VLLAPKKSEPCSPPVEAGRGNPGSSPVEREVFDEVVPGEGRSVISPLRGFSAEPGLAVPSAWSSMNAAVDG